MALAESDDCEQRILQLLVVSGYFRARIQTLSLFDKIVGGLAWALSATQHDVQLNFKENDTIKNRLKLGEAIESALLASQCPHPLQAHQINGLDLRAILPVIQYLVKQAYAFRQEAGGRLRLVSLHVARTTTQSTKHTDEYMRNAAKNIRHIDSMHTPIRRLRFKDSFAATTPQKHAARVLVEFGRSDLVDKNEENDSKQGRAEHGDSNILGTEETPLNEATSADGELSRQNIISLVGLGAEDIHNAADEFAKNIESLQSSSEMVALYRKRAEAEELERQIEHESAAMDEEESRAIAASQEVEAAHLDASKLDAMLSDQERQQREAKLALSELEERVAAADANGVLAPLRSLLAELEARKSSQKGFKADCVKEISSLEESIATASASLSEEEIRRSDEAASLRKSAEEKANRLRQLVGVKNRQIQSLQRTIDQRPSRAELMQYEARFRELYHILAAKSEETKSHFNSFNRLEERRGCLEKEASLLESIHTSFEKAIAAGTWSMEKLADSLDSSKVSVEQSVLKMKARLGVEEREKASLEESHEKLLHSQRQFYRLVSEVQALLK